MPTYYNKIHITFNHISTIMSNKTFNATSLSSKSHSTRFVNESKTAELYSHVWDDVLSVEDKLNIAKQLGLNLTNSTAKLAFADLYDDKDIDVAWQIVSAKLDESHLMNLDVATKMFAETHNFDEGVISWVVGALVARKLWQKLSKSFKNKILKAAGVPQQKFDTYNELPIDKLPIAYKDAVNQVLRKHGVKIDESEDDFTHIHVSNYIDILQAAQESVKQDLIHHTDLVVKATENAVQADTCNNVPMCVPITFDDELRSLIKSKIGSNVWFVKNESGMSLQQQVQEIAGVQFEEALHMNTKDVDVARLFAMLKPEKQQQLLMLLNRADLFVESFDDNLAAIVEFAKHKKLDQMTLMSLTIQHGYDIASAINSQDEAAIAKAYSNMSRTQRNMLHDSLDIKFVVESVNKQATVDVLATALHNNDALFKTLLQHYKLKNLTATSSLEDIKTLLSHKTSEDIVSMCRLCNVVIVSEDVNLNEDGSKSVIQKKPNGMWGILGKDRKTFWDADYDTEEDAKKALAAYHANFVNESLSNDGKIMYSSAGVASPTSSIKAILSWLCYDSCQTTHADWTQAQLLNVSFDTDFDFKQLNVATVVSADGTPKLDGIMMPTVAPSAFKSGFVAQLFDSTGHSMLVFVVDGEWCIVDNADVIAEFFKRATTVDVVYKASANLPNMLPNLKRQPSNDIALVNLYQICKRADSTNNSYSSLVHAKQQFELQASPSIAKNSIAYPSPKEFLSSIKTLTIVPDNELLIVNVNNKELVYANVAKRWYKIASPEQIDALFANIADVDLPKEDVTSMSQADINSILSMWQIASPLSKIASVRTKAAKLEVLNVDKDIVEVVDIVPNVDMPAMLSKIEESDNISFKLSFMYDGKLYQLNVQSQQDLTNNFKFVDTLCQAFQI